MIVVTGAPGCNYCVMLEKVVQKAGVDYEKVDISTDDQWMARVQEGGNKMPACIFIGDARYAVSREQPAKVPAVIEWLKENNAL